MTKFEWIQRCRMQFARRTQEFSYDWIENAEVCYDEMCDYEWNSDPEGYADEEMSNWD